MTGLIQMLYVAKKIQLILIIVLWQAGYTDAICCDEDTPHSGYLLFLWQAEYTDAICCDEDTPHSNYYFYDRLDTKMLLAVMKIHLILIIILMTGWIHRCYMLWWRYTSLWLLFLWQAGYTDAICCDEDTPHSNCGTSG